jgi:signal transduction histidine kinase
VVAFLALVWAIYQLRVQQLHRQFAIRLNERTRIARELHDTFLQTIQGSKLVADDALEHLNDPIRTRHSLQRLSDWLERATKEGRAALHALRASATEENELAAALLRALEDSRKDTSMEVQFAVTGDARDMHPIVRDEVYRIGYEAIRNACAHSKSTQLEVGLNYSRDLTVRVRDNGVGIDPAVVEKGKQGHLGLRGMRERAARIGGKLTVVSSPNAGTEVALVVPGRIVFRKPRPRFVDKISVFRNV